MPTAMDARTQAEEWFARLRAADCTEAERGAFERWCAEDPEHEAAFRQVERLWHRSGALHRHPAIVAATREALADAAPQPRRVARRRWRVPAAAAAVIALALAMGPSLGPEREDHFVTAANEQRSIALADGSGVLLDGESELLIRYDDRERRLILERGQAQFMVERDDADRPFVVQAGDGAVTALGTVFQVRVKGKEVAVTLLEGRVSVDVPDIHTPAAPKIETLIAGEQIRFDSARESWSKQPADLEVAQSWTRGDLVFQGWRLDDFVKEMNRYADTQIRIADPSLGKLLVSGRFHMGDQESLVLALQNDWPIRATRASGDEIVLHRRQQMARE